MFSNNRFLLIIICFTIVVIVPWRTETILPAEVISASVKSSVDNIELNCTASVVQCMEIASGQDAIFFPESDQINPFYISLHKMGFSKQSAHISGSPVKVNQVFEGTIKGVIAIKGERKSLLMRAYSYLFHS
ncbi:MAG: hypothetical protein Q8Q56_04330 [Alphaproteobacteria bacterium]|nr:hypothetical protein [Alphaproteobacteria bacterium]